MWSFMVCFLVDAAGGRAGALRPFAIEYAGRGGIIPAMREKSLFLVTRE
jgi:hypothetical protein